MNAVEQARENGRKAGIARREKDQSRVTHWLEYQSKCVTCAKTEDKKAMVEAFNEAYSSECTPTFAPFR